MSDYFQRFVHSEPVAAFINGGGIMSDFITRSFEWAQLALASYTNLQDFTQGSLTTDLRNALLGDFPFPLANAFSGVIDSQRGFQVLSQRTDLNGFSATLFERIGENNDGSHDKFLGKKKRDRLLFWRFPRAPA